MLRVFDIPKGRFGGGTLSGSVLRMDSGLDLPACVLCPKLIEQILERHEVGQTLLGILVVRDGDEANLLFREEKFQVVIHHHMLTPEPGKVFDQDTVDFACLNVLQHPLKTWAFKVGAGPAIVHVFIHNEESLITGVCV